MTGGLLASDLTVVVEGTTLVNTVSLRARPGTLTALIGPNGAGKTTLIRVLAGVTRPTAGTVSWNGSAWATLPRRARAQIAALVEQDARAELPMTVESVIALGRVPYRALFAPQAPGEQNVVRTAMDQVGISSLAGRQFDSLSGGERQRVHLARALAQQPALLLLDEPTNHLDVHAQLDTLELAHTLAHEEGVTVIAALHDLNLAAAYADEIVVLARGSVVATGSPEEVLTPELLRAVYRVEATVLEHPVTGRPLIAYSPQSTPRG